LTDVLKKNAGKLNTIVDNTERASHRFEPLLKSADDTVGLLQTRVLPKVQQTLTTIQPLLESSRDTLGEFQTQILPQTRKALINLDRLSTALTGVATKIDRDPSIIIRGAKPPSPGPGESP
jgi:phospholipid/cholesterol/gamma-HCH transport system substrate-binding protein